jgi:predicted secreted hydrolase/threonine/homoserine/homoserine lactone efflux protein
MIDILLKGIAIGFSIAAPVGPIGVLCIRRTLSEGRTSGFVSGLGAATADAVYGCIAGFGLTFVSSFLIDQQIWIRLIGGLFLCYLGIRTFLAVPASEMAPASSSGLIGAYGSTLVLTLTNPLTILSFAAIFAGLGIADTGGDYGAAAALVLGVFVGSGLWWLLLSSIASVLRSQFNTRALLWINRVSGFIILVFGLIALSSLVAGDRSLPPAQIDLVDWAGTADGFARATPARSFDFPIDHGPHIDYQTEWWYYTGNLDTADGHHFGYQLTFFRRSLAPPVKQIERRSDWATHQVYMAHFAITDVAGKQHQAFERFSRGAAGLAGAESPPFRVWLENWHVEAVEPDRVRLYAAQGDATVDLVLTGLKGPILQGDGGYSQKGQEQGNASYYYSQTRLETAGTVQIADERYAVNGLSWMDHEFSTSALAPDQVGWDWFALQLDDGSELMMFQIRKADGSIDPYTSGTLITPDGTARHLSRADFEIAVQATWRSPNSGATYPARWTVSVPAVELTLAIAPYLADQELNVSYAYWEGAVRITGEQVGSAVSGSGYVEMTGYAGSMQGQF